MPNDINSQITRITGNVAAAYTAALAKGATMPQTQNSDNLADTVASIAIPQTQTKSATPSLSSQTITPDSGKLLSGVTVNPITAQLLANLDADFAASNIADGVDMFGTVGTFAGKAFQVSNLIGYTTQNSLIATGLYLEVEKTGIYTVRWFATRQSVSGSTIHGTQLIADNGDTEIGEENTTWELVGEQYVGQANVLTGVRLVAGQYIEVYGRGRSGYRVYTTGLSITEE